MKALRLGAEGLTVGRVDDRRAGVKGNRTPYGDDESAYPARGRCESAHRSRGDQLHFPPSLLKYINRNRI